MTMPSHLLAMLALGLGLGAAGCTKKSNIRPIEARQDNGDPAVDESPSGSRGPTFPAGDASELPPSGELTPEEEQASTDAGLKKEDAEKGKLLVNGWDGLGDQIPADGRWGVKNVKADAPSTPATGGSTADKKTDTKQPADDDDTATDDDDTATDTAKAGPVTFHIKKGTGQNAWNTDATTVVAHVGQTFTIVNDDSITHQWHTNGAPCQHGNPIPPGGSTSCTPSRAYNGGPLYDHLTDGKFYIRAE